MRGADVRQAEAHTHALNGPTQTSVARHPLLTLSVLALVVFALVSSLRKHARRMASSHSQRLPHYATDKAD